MKGLEYDKDEPFNEWTMICIRIQIKESYGNNRISRLLIKDKE